MLEDWDAYITSYEEQRVTIKLNLDAINEAPVEGFKYLVKTRMEGKPTFFNKKKSPDMKLLFQIEDDILDNIPNQNVHIVGILTGQYIRDFYFYTSHKENLTKELENILLKYKAIQFKTVSEVDVNWDFYKKTLYPDEYGLRCITDRRVMEELRQNGDTLTEARETSHWIYFKDPINRKVFSDKVEQKGFAIEKIEDSHDEEEFPYKLVICRVHKVDWGSVYNITSYLMTLAKEHEGKYDGWQTYVVK